MLARFKKKMDRSTTVLVSSQPATSYRWCHVEQMDRAAPLANRGNGWRYMGLRGVAYHPSAGRG